MTKRAILLAAVVAVIAIASQRGEAHKAITSKYTFNDDVFPIFRDRCARCHVDQGVAPMSLTTYEKAFPWAESIRAELIAGHMPPWHAEEGFGELKHARTLTAKELDVVLTWATGGNPQGNLDQKLPAVTLKNDWGLGAPDLALPLPSEFTVPADTMDVTQDFTISTGLKEAKWIRAVDLRPGTPSVVRNAVIYLKNTAAPQSSAGSAERSSADRLLALWLPGHDPEPLESQVAFRLPAGAELGVRIHYKKTWQFEGQAIADRSTIGIYFAPEREAQELLTVVIASLPPAAAAQRLVFTRTIAEDVQALAVRPDEVPPNITLQMTAFLPDGVRAPMIRLNTRLDWARRYWFEKPIALPRGSRIEVVANLENPDILSEAFGAIASTPKARVAPPPLTLAVNVIPAKPKPIAP